MPTSCIGKRGVILTPEQIEVEATCISEEGHRVTFRLDDGRTMSYFKKYVIEWRDDKVC